VTGALPLGSPPGSRGPRGHDRVERRTGGAPEGTQVVGRVFDILDAFVTVAPKLTVADVSRELGLKYATAHRILEAMASRGVLSRDRDSRRYSMGPRLREYASSGRVDEFDVAHPYLEALTRRTGETSHLAILDAGSAVYIDTVAGARLLSAHRHVGRQMPLHSTGVGKALLSTLRAAEVDAVLGGELTRYTVKTIMDREVLHSELERIRSLGYAVDDEETEDGLVCVAAVVLAASGKARAAVSVGGPATRIRQDLELIARAVMSCADELAKASGWAEL